MYCVPLEHRSWQREEEMAYCPHWGAVCAHFFVCALYMCPSTHIEVDVDGTALSCHHIHSTSQWADKAPR